MTKNSAPGELLFSVSNHLKKLAKTSPAVHRQFYPSQEELLNSLNSYTDPLLEDKFEKTKGLIHKYPGRVLILLTAACAAYCRFCTRRRRVSDIKGGLVTRSDIDNMAQYLSRRRDVTEVIFSGGDPLTQPSALIYALNKFKKLKTIKIVRIHTRLPVSSPRLLSTDLLSAIRSLRTPVYVSLHFEHPDEITKPTINAIKKLHQAGCILLSQSVFLKGVNDSYPVLFSLFSILPALGIHPYYIYHCDPVKGAEHFLVPLKKEIAIMTKLRANLSGIACPTHVIDTPNGSGKIPVPLNFWQFDQKSFADYEGKLINLS